LDISERFRNEGPTHVGETPVFEQTFLEIVADDGTKGLFSPISTKIATTVEKELQPLLLGEDPFAIEKIWDITYRSQVHGRKGETMMAISAVDCALWDLIGKAKGEPVVKLLGGPTREKNASLRQHAGLFLEARERYQSMPRTC